ncbi:hypothetical protein PENTCL1PPCAC_3004 [Pristionchus entomophagus]|uniref:MATH domain-containing protein n=1 Tax=Pristionchus entomophagus TaxID=358040 RepID=A0AAV5SL52_9BILA|nr:hypothetical protein PENTCL1PPCAC_3004 [Pristionchus entomophagus]
MPPKKKQKKEEVMRLQLDDSKSGIIRFEVDEISTLNEDGRKSPEIEVEGVSWSASVYKDHEETGACGLGVYLSTKECMSPLWSVDVEWQMILVHSDSNMDMVRDVEKDTYDHDGTSWGWTFMINWDDLIDEGFINDDKITVEIRFNVKKTRGIRMSPRIDFSDPREPIHDVALVIQERRSTSTRGFSPRILPSSKRCSTVISTIRTRRRSH